MSTLSSEVELINRRISELLNSDQFVESTALVCRRSVLDGHWTGIPALLQQSLPVYDGSVDPLIWLMKAEIFFYFFKVPEEEKIPYASLHLDGEAIHWLVCTQKSQRLASWKDFKNEILSRFSIDAYDSPTARLFRLKQTTNVSEYYSAFEALMVRIPDWGEKAFVDKFVAGLKEDLKTDVSAFDPQNMDAAFKLARMYEHKMAQSSMNLVPNNENLTDSSSGGDLPVKKLTPREMRERISKNLCYNCDEKFVAGHKCAKQTLYFMVGEWEDSKGEVATNSFGAFQLPMERMANIGFYGRDDQPGGTATSYFRRMKKTKLSKLRRR